MKQLFFSGLCLLLFQCVPKPKDINVSRITGCQGSVSYESKPGASLRKAVTGLALQPGSTIVTHSDSQCNIQIGDGAVICIREKSRIKCDQLFKDEKTGQEHTKVNIAQGKAIIKINKILNKDDSFSIQTPSVIAGVRGTEFSIDASGEKADKIAELRGKLMVRRKISVIDNTDSGQKYSGAVVQAVSALAEDSAVMLEADKEIAFTREESRKLDNIITQIADRQEEQIKKNTPAGESAGSEKNLTAVNAETVAIFTEEARQQIIEKVKEEKISETVPEKLSAETADEFTKVAEVKAVPLETLKELKETRKEIKENENNIRASEPVQQTAEEPASLPEEKIPAAAEKSLPAEAKTKSQAREIKKIPTPKPEADEDFGALAELEVREKEEAVKAAETNTVNSAEPAKKEFVFKKIGFLSIWVEPRSAAITAKRKVGRQIIAKDCKVGKNTLEEGKYLIRITCEGYKPVTRQIDVKYGYDVREQITMEKN